MKRVIFILSFAIISSSLLAQSEKRMKYGFNLGLNYSNILTSDGLPDNVSISNDIGFRLGIIAEYKFSKIFFIAPKAELSFNNGSGLIQFSDGINYDYKIMPVSIDAITHFVFKDEREKINPYFFVGPNVRIPLNNQPAFSSTFKTRTDVAIDFGIGIEKPFTHFNFSPELSYSLGLLNINTNPLVQNLHFHNIALIINFIG